MLEKAKVLIVEDDTEIRQLIELYLKSEFQVLTADTGREAVKTVKLHSPDLVLLDILLPEFDGLEVCKKIRAFNVEVPILFLSAKSEFEDRIIGLEVGADDYITKPFDPGEVLARVRAHLRRKEIASKRLIFKKSLRKIGDLEINMENYTVLKKGKPVQLFTKELQLLHFLVKNPNQVFSIEQLYDQIWGEYKLGDYRTVKVHISNLRKKIEDDPTKPHYIQTVRGFGYKFALEN